jgi:hypothetical protein
MPSTIKQELSALGNKYPGLRNPDTTASKAAKAVYEAFVKDGQPKGYYTGLKAVKAVLDVRPDLLGAPPKPVPQASVPADVAALAARMLPFSDKHPDEKTPGQRALGAMERFNLRTATAKDTAPSLVDVLRRRVEQ